MRILKGFFSVVFLTGSIAISFFAGCTREMAVPVSPIFNSATSTPTDSPTVTNTLTATHTFTPTLSPTPTITNTPNGPTNTPTNTGTSTPTPTITNTPTNTFTSTDTMTPTNSPTPTPDYTLIDDFKGTGGSGSDSTSGIYSIQDENNKWRDGYWYAASDGPTVIFSGTGTVNPTCIEYATNFATYAKLVFTFTNPSGSNNAGVTFYDATVGGRYTGISFWAKINTMPTTVCGTSVPFWVDFVDSQPVSDHSAALPFTTSWKQYTVYFNQVGFDGPPNDANSTALNPVSITAIAFAPQNEGIAAFQVDFSVDDVRLVSSAAPAAPTAPSANMIDDFADGNNQVIVNNGSAFDAGSASGRNGFWFVSADNFGVGTTQCPNGSVNGTVVFPDGPGYGGTQDFAAHMFGVMGTDCSTRSYSNCVYALMGCNFLQPSGPVNCSSFTGIQFYAKWGGSSNTPGIWVKVPQSTTAGTSEGGTCSSNCDNHFCSNVTSITTSWQLIQVPFSGLTQQLYWGTVVTWDPTSLIGVQYELDNTQFGKTYDLWVDNLSFY